MTQATFDVNGALKAGRLAQVKSLRVGSARRVAVAVIAILGTALALGGASAASAAPRLNGSWNPARYAVRGKC